MSSPEPRPPLASGALGDDGELLLPTPRAGDAAEVLRAASEAAERGERVAMATVLARRGSTPSTPGQKLVLTESGTSVGTVGGGAIEREVLREMLAWLADLAFEERAAKTHEYKLGPELGMCCGGGVDILLETITSATPSLVVGAGHIGTVVAPLLARCGFAVTLVDDREQWALASADELRVRRVAGDFAFVGKSVPRRGVALAMTHDHQLDQRVIEWALREKFAFVGGVGSRAKHARTCARLEAKGFTPQDIARVRMPLGLDLGARTPDEIAVSIVAELVAWRRGKAGR
jgi:xanthine dehydrogenase accessory factor